MGYTYSSGSEESLQKKLIPLNILVAIISLVSAVTLIFTPLLKVNIGKIIEAAASQAYYSEVGNFVYHTGSSFDINGGDDANEGDVTDEENTENEGDNNNVNEGGSSGGSLGGQLNEENLISLIVKMTDADLSFTPLSMAKVLMAPEEEKSKILFAEFLLNNGLFENMMVSMLNVTLVAATELVSADELYNVNFNKIIDKFLTIDNVKSAGEFNSIVEDYISVMETEVGGKLDEEAKDAVMQMCTELYDTTMEYSDDGTFTIEKMVCAMASKSSGIVVTSYSEIVEKMVVGDFSFQGMEMVLEPLDMIAPYYGYIFIFVAVVAFAWFVLFLFSFLRLFAKNKRFMTWYVKLVGCWPCLICGVLPAAMSGVNLFDGMMALTGALTTFTWISGACYLLLWMVSIFWAFPIKHKIRRLRKF